MKHERLTETIIGCAMKVHHILGPGFFESVYQKALAHELTKAGVSVALEAPIIVHYDDIPVGNFFVDLLVEDTIVVEMKATQALIPENEVQLVNYLNALRKDIGLLLNFGSSSLQIKRKHREYTPSPKNNPVKETEAMQTPSLSANNPVNPGTYAPQRGNPVKETEAMQASSPNATNPVNPGTYAPQRGNPVQKAQPSSNPSPSPNATNPVNPVNPV